MSAEPMRLLFALLHNVIHYKLDTSNAQQHACNAMCKVAKDIEDSNVCAAISTAVQQLGYDTVS